jgi:hypothetical protein
MERFKIDKSLFGLYSTQSTGANKPSALSFDLDAIMSGNIPRNKDRFKLDPLLTTDDLRKVGNVKKRLNRKLVDYEVPLAPLYLNVTNKHKATWLHLKNKFKTVETLDIKTIGRSVISTHEIYSNKFKDPRSKGLYPFRSVR